MLDGILNQRLQDHAGHVGFERLSIELLGHTQLLAEADHFDVEIVVDELNFFAQLHEGLLLVQKPAKDAGKLEDHGARGIGTHPHQG